MARKRLPVWSVHVEEHVVGGRWEVPEQTLTVYAEGEREARAAACRQLHCSIGASPWRPLLRFSYCRTSATRVDERQREGVPR